MLEGTPDLIKIDVEGAELSVIEGLQKILDLMAPSAMEVKRNEIILNDTHCRTLYAYNWPNYIYPNWLSQIINLSVARRLDSSRWLMSWSR